ncbi:hypothetical protein TanjilG_08206 [Lupinus angustifolius]|uniref:PUM-HD domain-containing protein n=1 Tax=Lupinus angustifolius TaxID=3871 RepID=A0A1J7HS68_LUPAN|nr:PREDICTED: pumilio homolog 12-like [Lupinus angustifolius]OIW15630.1 hypothetical protein TanjilG_08206 [Lupinus angustifolius]
MSSNAFSDVPYSRGEFSDISWLNQNPIQMNQISLEEAFSHLSFNHTPLGFNGYGLPPLSNRCDVGAIPSQNRGYTSGYADASPFVSQKQFQRFSSNEELLCSAELQRKFRGDALNELRNNTNGLNVTNNVRRNQRWLQQQNLNHRSIYDFRGRILFLAMEQGGCRVLQEIMKRLKSEEEISFIFVELINNVMELMMDPFGNYVFQKLVEICSEQQRTHIILVVTNSDFHFVTMCLDIHGTRAVQKLLEHVTTQEQRSLIMSALSPGAVALTKDINGIHVVEHCLKHFSNEDNRYLLNVVANNCFEIATDKSGCCVMHHCLDYAQGETKELLMAEIIVNASLLSEDCYGNYVVQHLVTMKIPRVTENLLRQLEGKFLLLSCNKYGSNVVERIFLVSEEQYSARIILELLHNPNVSRLLVDPFGNYVTKTALMVSKGAIHNAILELIQLHSAMMRSNIYGKKLLDRVDSGKIRHM